MNTAESACRHHTMKRNVSGCHMCLNNAELGARRRRRIELGLQPGHGSINKAFNNLIHNMTSVSLGIEFTAMSRFLLLLLSCKAFFVKR